MFFWVSFEGFFKGRMFFQVHYWRPNFFLSQQSCVFTKKMLWILYILILTFFWHAFSNARWKHWRYTVWIDGDDSFDEKIKIYCILKEIICIFFLNLKNKHKQIIIYLVSPLCNHTNKKNLESIIIIYQFFTWNYNFSIYYIIQREKIEQQPKSQRIQVWEK